MLHKEAGTSNEKTAAQMVYSKKYFLLAVCVKQVNMQQLQNNEKEICNNSFTIRFIHESIL